MGSFKPTFIPIPQVQNLRYPPETHIVLGTILTDDRDPRIPLCRKPVVPIKDDEIIRDQEPWPWHWDSNDHISGKARIPAKIPGLPVGGGLSGEGASNTAVVIDSKHVKTQFFSPDLEYLQKVTENPIVESYTEKRGRPWAHLVISIMIAESATFEITRGKQKGFKAELQADASGAGVPAAVAAEAGANKQSGSTLKSGPIGPFVLAYQLLKVRPRKDGTAERKADNQPALFDDSESAAQDLMDEWEIEETTAKEIWEDE